MFRGDHLNDSIWWEQSSYKADQSTVNCSESLSVVDSKFHKFTKNHTVVSSLTVLERLDKEEKKVVKIL